MYGRTVPVRASGYGRTYWHRNCTTVAIYDTVWCRSQVQLQLVPITSNSVFRERAVARKYSKIFGPVTRDIRIDRNSTVPPKHTPHPALGNPVQLASFWIPVDSTGHTRSEASLRACGNALAGLPGPPRRSRDVFCYRPGPQSLWHWGRSRYLRNKGVPECAENTALDGEGTALDPDTMDLILRRVQPTRKREAQTSVDFKTLLGGSLSVEARVGGPFYPDVLLLPDTVSVSPALLSSLRCTHKLRTASFRGRPSAPHRRAIYDLA
ncbi:hypothetical protein GGX14DRAFT_667906 [Mycena pura]|uniref:Uncharacterized protein n=1 Tax=Mycena pura TaxID=153505 RepID=A0AAD6Y9A0_9AGAR|nr:hypothetical protein GGX14DRAFT_667906 [Mycena pura]